LRLFVIRDVVLCNIVAFLAGFVMFGAISFLPVYFQEIVGNSPTTSGLKLLPMMLGIIVASIGSGVAITKTGHYWHYPILGCAFCGLGCGLLYLITTDYSYDILAIFILIVGLGIGLLIQTLLIVTQFSVQKSDMAVATATNSFVRTMGGVIGVTVMGAILNTVLKQKVSGDLLNIALSGYSAITTLPAAQQSTVFSGYVDALRTVFIAGVPVSGLAVLFSFAITRKALAKRVVPVKGSPTDPNEVVVDDIPPMEI